MRATPVEIVKVTNDFALSKLDLLAAEEPLEIRIGFGPHSMREQKSIAITMRTPGNDLELTVGFLFTEGIISKTSDLTHIDHCTDSQGERSENVVRAEIHPNVDFDWTSLQRNFYTSSSCGICGKASIESLQQICPLPIESEMKVEPDVIHQLSLKMREKQSVFEHTGGLHAAALFTSRGELILMREDVGRHNALDKVIGAAVFKNLIPINDHVILLSGRCCYELIQKSVLAGLPIIAAVGAPSSLAVETARSFGQTLLGFVRNNSFNIYSHGERILTKHASTETPTE